MRKNNILRPASLKTMMVGVIFLVACSSAASAKNLNVDCSGQTQSAFTSIQQAVDSLDAAGPNQIVIASGSPCSENVTIIGRQGLTITGGGGNAAVASAVGLKGDVFTIQGSTGIVFDNLDVSGGNRGIAIARNSEVTITGASVFGNRGNGIFVDGNSSLTLIANVHDNGATGVNVTDSLIKVVNSQFSSNGGNGVTLTRSRGSFQNVTASNNSANGIIFVNGSSGQLTAPTSIQNNRLIGIEAMDGSSVRMFGVPLNPPLSNVVEGNGFIGIGIFSADVALFNGNIIRNNGIGGLPFSAGIRVDDNAVLLGFGAGGNIQVTGNTGSGIESTAGGNVDLAGTAISNNTGDGIRGQGHVHVIFFPPANDTVSGNGGRSVNCDASSVFVGDPTGIKDMRCEISPVDSPSMAIRIKHMQDSEDDD